MSTLLCTILCMLHSHYTSTIHLFRSMVNFNGVNMFHPHKPKHITNFMGPSFQCQCHYTSTDLINNVSMTHVPSAACYPKVLPPTKKCNAWLICKLRLANFTYWTCLITPSQSNYNIKQRLDLSTTTLHTTGKKRTEYLRPPLLNGRRWELLPRNIRPCPRRNLNVSPPPLLRFTDCMLWLRTKQHTHIQCHNEYSPYFIIKLNSFKKSTIFFKVVWMLYHWMPLHGYPF
jgi:hypothetical protein